MSWMSEGFQALTTAAREGDLAKVKQLLKEKVNPNDDFGAPRGWSPLMTAAYYGHLEVVKLLVKHHARLDAVEIDGWLTALDLAIMNSKDDVVSYLKAVHAPLGKNVPNPHRGGKLGGWVTDER